MRYGPVQVVLDVPDGDLLPAWAADAHKQQAASVVFFSAAGGSALETLHLPGAYCVAYQEQFARGEAAGGSYQCLLTLSDPAGWTLAPGGPAAAFVAPAAGDHVTAAAPRVVGIGGAIGAAPVSAVVIAAATLAQQATTATAKAQTYEELGLKPPCFLAGTLIHTPAGERPIEELVAGDVVWAYDFSTAEVVARPVVGVMRNWTRFVVALTLDGDVVRATREHRFWVPEAQGWTAAAELAVGTRVLTLDGRQVRVEQHRVYEAEAETYNFEVAELHTYFVGTPGILVHNARKKKAFVASKKFSNTIKVPTKIYAVTDPKTKKVVYVGQTIYPTVEQRFDEHLAHPKKKHWKKGKYKVKEVHQGNWTPYEASVWEQHYIQKHGGKQKPNDPSTLENKREEITKEKYNIYKAATYRHDPCP